MFPEYLSKRLAKSTYAPLCPTSDLFVQVIHSSGEAGLVYDASLIDLMGREGCEDGASMFIFDAAHCGLFILWTCCTATTSANSIDDILGQVTRFLGENTETYVCVSFNPRQVKEEDDTADISRSILAVFTRYHHEAPAVLGLALDLQEKIARTHQVTKCSKLGTIFQSPSGLNYHSLVGWPFLLILLLVACTFTIISLSAKVFTSGHLRDAYHSWVAYDTSGSVGPRYQLSLTGQNASDWTSYMQDHGEWALRIDDQALIPLQLMDDEEKHYQHWFQNRYPEMNSIRINHDYINGTWLSSPLVDLVPADDLFHFSHCVLAVKRYIKAKETGLHVCGRDVDYDHMHHCLDALDRWAFPSGKRGEPLKNHQRTFWWRTKVCFD